MKQLFEIMKATLYIFGEDSYLVMVGENMAIKQMKVHKINDAYSILTWPTLDVIQKGYCNGSEAAKKILYDVLGMDYNQSADKLKVISDIPPQPGVKISRVTGNPVRPYYSKKRKKGKKDIHQKTADKLSKLIKNGKRIPERMPINIARDFFMNQSGMFLPEDLFKHFQQLAKEGKVDILHGTIWSSSYSALRRLHRSKQIKIAKKVGKTCYYQRINKK